MPIVRIDYDNNKLSDKEIVDLSNAIQPFIAEKTSIPEVMVYANYSHITLKIFPIEIFVEMSADKIPDRKKLVEEIRDFLTTWKKETDFQHLINLTLIPMDWDMEFDI